MTAVDQEQADHQHRGTYLVQPELDLGQAGVAVGEPELVDGAVDEGEHESRQHDMGMGRHLAVVVGDAHEDTQGQPEDAPAQSCHYEFSVHHVPR